ncbi:MAG: magnesium transporter, partial [Asticcacaulis sp.]|nr:magnesium transporter [Asticcacaulis sp.]
MLTIHTCSPAGHHPVTDTGRGPLHALHYTNHGNDVGDHAVWLDLLNPTRDEELSLEERLGVLLPTREDMDEIETSSRLYIENGAAFMTALVAFFGGEEQLQTGPVTFVLAKGRLVTIRYIDPASFAIFADHIEKQPVLCATGAMTFLNLVDVVIDRTADLIEKTAAGIDRLSRAIFRPRRQEKLESILNQLGRAQNDIAKARDSLVSLARLAAFASGLERESTGLKGEEARDWHDRLRTMGQDVASLSDHATYVTGNITFLLDAALGLINLEQNNIVKVISITSVIFLP